MFLSGQGSGSIHNVQRTWPPATFWYGNVSRAVHRHSTQCVPVSCSCLLHAEHQAKSTPPSLVPVCVVESRPEAAARLALSTPTKVDHRSAGTVSLRWGKWHFRFFYTSLASSLFAFLCSTWIRWTCATNEAHVRLTPPLHSAYRREAPRPRLGHILSMENAGQLTLPAWGGGLLQWCPPEPRSTASWSKVPNDLIHWRTRSEPSTATYRQLLPPKVLSNPGSTRSSGSMRPRILLPQRR